MATTTVNLIDQIGGKGLKALVATNDGSGNNIATQLAAKIEGVGSTAYPDAPTKVVVVASLPSVRDPNTIYLVPETYT
jgi:hypothetical protein